MALPCVLFSSSDDDFSPDDFVKKILKVAELPKPVVSNDSDSINSYEWQFETKYYRTTIHLSTTMNRTIGDKEFAESVQAFVHFFNPNKPSSFELAKAWLPYLSHIEPEVQMLVCNTSRHSDAVARQVALEWCIKNDFELVELQPEQDSDDEEDDFPETTGMERIIQALHAHTWPNLDMKNSPTIQSPLVRQMMKEQHLINQQQNNQATEDTESSELHTTAPVTDASEATDPPLSCNDCGERTTTNSTPTSGGDEALSTSTFQQDLNSNLNASNIAGVNLDDIDWRALLGNEAKLNEDVATADDDMGVEEFEQLFMKLKVMKDKAQNMPVEERKKYAEKVAVSFWKAIGGDEDEIEGLDELVGTSD